MFGRKKKEVAPPPPRKGGGNRLMAQMGIVDDADMASVEADIYGDEDDAELEAELAMLAGEDAPKAKTSPKKGPMSMDTLNKMVSNTMNYNPDSDDETLDVDDPELLAELQMLSTNGRSPELAAMVVVQPAVQPAPSAELAGLLQERLTMYQTAALNAQEAGDPSKARRLERGLKSLQDLLRNAQAGRPVPEDEIPPAVSMSARPTPVSSPLKEQPAFPPPPTFEQAIAGSRGSSGQSSPVKQMSPLREDPALPSPVMATAAPPDDKRAMLIGRRDQYRRCALAAKRSGDETKARHYIKTAKQFDLVILALDEGKPVDLSQMPPPPTEVVAGSLGREVARTQGAGPGPSQADLAKAAAAAVATRGALSIPTSPEEEEEPLPELAAEEKIKLFNAPTEAGTILEALEQRLEKYRASWVQAKGEQNSSKARRMERITKQYESAVKAHKAGRSVDYADLPTPPGFPPIPCSSPVKQPPLTPSPGISPSPSNTHISPPAPHPAARSPPAPQPAPRLATTAAPVPAPAPAPAPTQPGIQRQCLAGEAVLHDYTEHSGDSILSRAEQQAMFLQERQLAFKKEALKAKRNGDMELAKKYMRQAMGFDQMIEASKSGLPVDMSQVPTLPGLSEEKLEFISSEDAKPGDRTETFKSLQQELIAQIRTSTNNSEHFTKLGDVATAEKFNKIYTNARKDLESLKDAFKHGDPVPRYHYETRTYTLVKTCSDLGDDELQVTIVRGINYHLPTDYSSGDLHTYIKYELPFPSDDVQKGYSETVKGTNNPEYDQAFSLKISRKSRSFLRFLKHKTLKIEVYYKRGFLKGDKVLGSTQIKLLPLENACVVHNSYDLTDGRHAVGGKVEVKLRVREPFLGKQVEEVKEKWLIIDRFDRVLPAARGANQPASNLKAPEPPTGVPPVASMRVLEYEKQLLDRQIQQMAGQLTRVQEEEMRQQSSALGRRAEELHDRLRRGGTNALKAHAMDMEGLMGRYLAEAGILVKQGNRDKAELLVTKKKLVEKEVETIRARLPAR